MLSVIIFAVRALYRNAVAIHAESPSIIIPLVHELKTFYLIATLANAGKNFSFSWYLISLNGFPVANHL